MAENKKTIVVYTDWASIFNQLEDEEAGKLIKHFFSYVNDESPILEDRFLKLAFTPIENQLKRDLKKWEVVLEKRSMAGKASAEARKKTKETEQQTPTNPTHVDFVELNSTLSTDNDNVNVNDNVNDIVIKDNIPEIKNFGNDIIDFNSSHAESLKNESQSWLESVSMQQKIPIEEIQTKIDEFVLFLKTTTDQHKNKKAFITHFVNWLPKQKNKIQNGKEQNSFGGKQQFRFSTDNAIQTILGDS